MRAVVTEIPGTLANPAAVRDPARPSKLRAAAAAFWLRAFFRAAERAPRVVLAARGPLCLGTFWTSAFIRRGTRANARRLLGPDASSAQVDALARRTLSSFYLACCDVGRSFSATREQLFARVQGAEGDEHFQAARAAGRGVIVVTAHMGSFEVGLAALRHRERGRIHVVFRRDPFERFERLRSGLRRRLGVDEAPVDDGWTVWLRLRDALLADEVIVLQGDRVMPGQRGEAVPFLGGRILLPAGPVKMALATGAPIVPIFSVRAEDGSVRLFVEPAIHVERGPDVASPGPHPALLQWARVLERYVRTYPDQWLMFQPALCEDAGPSDVVR